MYFISDYGCEYGVRGYLYVSTDPHGSQKRGSDPLELELQAVVSCRRWLRSSVRATRTLKPLNHLSGCSLSFLKMTKMRKFKVNHSCGIYQHILQSEVSRRDGYWKMFVSLISTIQRIMTANPCHSYTATLNTVPLDVTACSERVSGHSLNLIPPNTECSFLVIFHRQFLEIS